MAIFGLKPRPSCPKPVAMAGSNRRTRPDDAGRRRTERSGPLSPSERIWLNQPYEDIRVATVGVSSDRAPTRTWPNPQVGPFPPGSFRGPSAGVASGSSSCLYGSFLAEP